MSVSLHGCLPARKLHSILRNSCPQRAHQVSGSLAQDFNLASKCTLCLISSSLLACMPQLGGKRRPVMLCNAINFGHRLGAFPQAASQHALLTTLATGTLSGLTVLDVADLLLVRDLCVDGAICRAWEWCIPLTWCSGLVQQVKFCTMLSFWWRSARKPLQHSYADAEQAIADCCCCMSCRSWLHGARWGTTASWWITWRLQPHATGSARPLALRPPCARL